jgi:sigma-B regulation protein RsbU (phosphoserine phosphatase)
MRALRVLIVDDEEPARDRLRRMLETIDGVEVAEASDGSEALERIDDEHPDLIFLDIEMPGLSGIEVAKRLAPPRPRTVFCTAYDQYAVQAFDEDAADYVLKPVSQARLNRAVERVRRMVDEDDRLRHEAADARRAQAHLYPAAPETGTLEIAGRCVPAREVGGDYYDFLALGPGKLGIALGDVSGKGLYAGLLMAGLQARVQSLAPRHGAAELDQLVAELNRSLHRSVEIHRYATFFYGVYDEAQGLLTYVNAGHLPPLIVRSSTGSVESLDATGTVIGLLPESSWQARSTQLAAGDLFCAYTDGLTEAADRGGVEFGATRLGETILRYKDLPTDRLCDAVLETIDRFTAGAQASDDRTVIVARTR